MGTVVVAVLPGIVCWAIITKGIDTGPVELDKATDDAEDDSGEEPTVDGTLELTVGVELDALVAGRPLCPGLRGVVRPFLPFAPFGGGGSNSTSSLGNAAT